MITVLSKRISYFLCQKKIIKETDIEIYQYGFEIIFSTAIGFFITIFIGMIFHMFWMSLVHYLIFASIRQFTGGYHANTYLSCNLIFTAVTIIVLGFTKMAFYSQTYTLMIHFVILIVVVMIVWRYAPIENKNKPISEKQKKKNYILGLSCVLVIAVISCFAYFISKQLCILMAFSLLSIAVLIVISKLPERSERNEQDSEDIA